MPDAIPVAAADTTRPAYLVVGGDSLVGGGALTALRRRGLKAYASTRRRDTLNAERILLDFESSEPFRAPRDVGCAFVIAAATNYERCETDPMARVINVELIPRSVASLLEQGLHVSFVSTNSVFGGDRPWPNEDDPHDARIAYSKQKSEGEAVIMEAADKLGARYRLNIVRLTKIMNAGVSPLPSWFAAWGRGEPVEPFGDLIFAPISVHWVGEALAAIGEKRVAGNLHLSGAENVSYIRFAETLADRLGVARTLIRPTTATERGIHIAFKPRYSGLGMARTTELTGLRPQPFEALIDDLIADKNGMSTAG
jgi:dTDP-4-dehydrorhamnose reductase